MLVIDRRLFFVCNLIIRVLQEFSLQHIELRLCPLNEQRRARLIAFRACAWEKAGTRRYTYTYEMFNMTHTHTQTDARTHAHT